ncbi:hypothetical protein EB1_11820 [Empedobacter brevis NBRC 14943 = ATCC 43319]|uniref:Uncharacterized protein n=1 Tax=Empedobacter brevis NBRC 14943 = ATCC 43319 TaxID=1218108 RepID=A0A511NF06_9FLAO|nr:hypothetical protein EB1_11820 [Empedobacter brevis NBRC 14943 = ATCC 43319]
MVYNIHFFVIFYNLRIIQTTYFKYLLKLMELFFGINAKMNKKIGFFYNLKILLLINSFSRKSLLSLNKKETKKETGK